MRKAFQNQTLSEVIKDDNDPRLEQHDLDVVSDFTPNITIPVPTLRHVVFSTDGDFLVISAEELGGLAVFSSVSIVQEKKTDPEVQIDTGKIAIRALEPNPAPENAHFFAAVLESGRLVIVDVTKGTMVTIRDEGVSSVAWSTRGKAVIAGLQDGSVAIHMTAGDLKAVIPRPPNVDESFTGKSSVVVDSHSVKLLT